MNVMSLPEMSGPRAFKWEKANVDVQYNTMFTLHMELQRIFTLMKYDL